MLCEKLVTDQDAHPAGTNVVFAGENGMLYSGVIASFGGQGARGTPVDVTIIPTDSRLFPKVEDIPLQKRELVLPKDSKRLVYVIPYGALTQVLEREALKEEVLIATEVLENALGREEYLPRLLQALPDLLTNYDPHLNQ